MATTQMRTIAPRYESRQFGHLTVRGNDAYRLYGQSLSPKSERFWSRNHVLSVEEENAFLFHEAARDPLSTLPGPVPISNDPAFDKAVAERLNAPRWERAYRVQGDLSVCGNRGHLYVGGRLFSPSVAEKVPPYQTFPKVWIENMRKAGRKVRKVKSAILVRHTLGHIYYHTYHDLMAKIVWAEELGLPKDLPLIVSAKWATGHYGKHFVKTRLFSGREVIFQALDECIVSEELYWLRTPQFFRPHLVKVANSFEEQKPDIQTSSRLVLIREKKTHDNRYCDGMDALIADLVRGGYTAIDPGGLTIPEQKYLFSRATHVIAENGSGLTNLVHRQDGPMNIEAIMLSRSTTSTFQAMAKAFGFALRTNIIQSEKSVSDVRGFLDKETKDRILEDAFD